MRPFALIVGICLSVIAANAGAKETPTLQQSLSACEPTQACATPLPVRVVVVSLFEIGEDEGDVAGEFQLWKTRAKLNRRIPFPQGYHDLWYNPETQVLGMVTGIGTARSTASMMALGLDPRFDFAHAYFLVAGIAGIDPEDASIGSVAWARYVIDGDLGHEIDAREIPAGWKTGYFPRHLKGPNDTGKAPDASGGEMFVINPSLEAWAYDLTKDIELPDGPSIAAERAKYVDYPPALLPPVVLEGEQLSAMTFWHGKLLNEWANDWVRYWTSGRGEFVTSAMEDTGILQAATYLDAAGRIDRDRVLVLRAGSNFTMPSPGVDAATNLLRENEGYAGLEAAVENLYIVGSKVVDELVTHWSRYEHTTP